MIYFEGGKVHSAGLISPKSGETVYIAGDDGIDVVSSRKVRIRNCFIHTMDDCIAIKSMGRDEPAADCEDIEVEHCVFWNAAWGNALEIGFELRSDYV